MAQFFVLLVIFGAGISTLSGRQFNAVNEFDVRTVVKFAGVTGRWVANEKSNRPSTRDRQRCAVKLVNDDTPVPDGLQRNTGRKVVGCRVQRQVGGRRFRISPFENRIQRHSVSLMPRVKTTHVLDLITVRKRLQIFERKFQGPPDFSVYSQQRFRHSVGFRCSGLHEYFPGVEYVECFHPHAFGLAGRLQAVGLLLAFDPPDRVSLTPARRRSLSGDFSPRYYHTSTTVPRTSLKNKGGSEMVCNRTELR